MSFTNQILSTLLLPSQYFFPACGGDGTVGWILSVMDKMTFPNGQPAIGIIPLGTGNDLSRSLNWGGKFKEKPLQKVLLDVDKSSVIHMDRWVLHTKAKSEESQESPIEYSSDKLVRSVYILTKNL